MLISHRKNLKSYNSFGFDVRAHVMAPFRDIAGLRHLLTRADREILILGGGSNILLPGELDRWVLHNQIMGIEVVEEDNQTTLVSVGAGENWHNLVTWSVNRGLSGIENLALIPGTVGAAPIQNIGAYGMELCDTFQYLEAMNRRSGRLERFDQDACEFGYRHSVFKAAEKDQWVITRVVLALRKQRDLVLHYGNLQDILLAEGIEAPTLTDVYNKVIQIRKSKLPDPAQIGNAGSFFKNPIISRSQYDQLLQSWADMPCYAVDNERVKIPAAWLIDRGGWKGYREGDCGVHQNQALVMVNYGNATARQIRDLSEKIKASVLSKYDIPLETEVNILLD